MKKSIKSLKYLSIGLLLFIAQGCTSKKVCQTCDGSGQMKHSMCNGNGSLIGGFSKCFPCGGTGKIKCNTCDGKGEIDK